jgi:hypothetical protein
MHHVEIINTLIRKYGYATYLEIGVHTNAHCFNHIKAPYKTGVDPGYENPNERYDYKLESDEFFAHLKTGRTEFPTDMKWDCIFIDGLHLAEQVERDIINSLEHLSEGGTIVMHDCSPPSEIIAREEYHPDWPHPGEWCGTTWKAFYKFRTTRPDLRMWCVNDDYGVGIIQRGEQQLAPNDNPFYSYKVMDLNRKWHLNLITPDEFMNLFGGIHV